MAATPQKLTPSSQLRDRLLMIFDAQSPARNTLLYSSNIELAEQLATPEGVASLLGQLLPQNREIAVAYHGFNGELPQPMRVVGLSYGLKRSAIDQRMRVVHKKMFRAALIADARLRYKRGMPLKAVGIEALNLELILENILRVRCDSVESLCGSTAGDLFDLRGIRTESVRTIIQALNQMDLKLST